jgi:hypothetical protein
VLQKFIALAILGLTLAHGGAQEAAQPASHSTVFFAQDDQALDGFEENTSRTRPMVDALVLAVTGKSDLASAWRSLVSPKDRVGIKVTAAGGRYFSSHRGVVAALVAGMEQAGIPRSQIVIWDRNSDELETADFLPKREGYNVRAIDPPAGFDREATIAAPVLGKLIWGDLLFVEKQRRPLGKAKEESDQLSSTSHLARIVSRDVTKIINVPVLSDERGCGVAGALYNVTVPNVDNWRRFTHTDGPIATSPAELYADERIGPRVVLHVLDGLLAQYAGGPAFNPNYAFAHQTLYASKDPVALDATALRKIDEWRKLAKLPPLAKRGAWLDDAAAMGLGNAAETAIALERVQVAR